MTADATDIAETLQKQGLTDLAARILSIVERMSPQGYRFWFGGASEQEVGSICPQDHADIVYAAYLVGRADLLSTEAARKFQAVLAGSKLYGRPAGGSIATETPGAHITAYLMGAARLLQISGKAPMEPQLFDGWVLDLLIKDGLPRWPRVWTHHSWRVSHWIGGAPSILLQLARSGYHPEIDEAFVGEVLSACAERIVDQKTGLLRPYKSDALHGLFNAIYRLRHDPVVGELGGVVHLLWIFHALERPYVGRDALFKSSWGIFQREPFIEDAPYCLDFDIIQLVRTAAPGPISGGPLTQRAARMRLDIAGFLAGVDPQTYSLHKLPGALASMHEAALIEGATSMPEFENSPVDIIKAALWI